MLNSGNLFFAERDGAQLQASYSRGSRTDADVPDEPRPDILDGIEVVVLEGGVTAKSIVWGYGETEMPKNGSRVMLW